MQRNLTALFAPRSIAIIGASKSKGKVGAIVLKNIIESGYTGKIYPINPAINTLDDLRCYPDITSLPVIPDLAVIAIPAQIVLGVLKQIGEKGVKNVVIFSAGFKETGEEGKHLEQDLISIATTYKLNILGPNCLGYVSTITPVNVTFGQTVNQPGNLRFLSQSGAIASSIFDWCQASHLGFAEFVTLGNKADLNESHVLQHWLKNNHFHSSPENQDGMARVSPIGLYLESIVDGESFLHFATQASKKDPVFIIKPGKSPAAQKAMQSHTGAIAGADAVMDTAFKQAGVIRCQNLEDFFDYARAFAWENAPKGPNVAVISNAGGPAVISADVIAEEGLHLTEFDPHTHKHLLECLPRAASVLNPVDVLGDALAERYAQAAEIVMKASDVHAVIIILTPQVMTQIEKTAEFIGELSKRYHKPILCSFMGGSHITKGERILNTYKIPSFRFPERAIKALAAMWRWQEWRLAQNNVVIADIKPSEIKLEKINAILSHVRKDQRSTLDSFEANVLLKAVSIPTPPTDSVATVEKAEYFCRQHDWPVVLKLSSPQLLHKTESGGVITNISTQNQLEETLRDLRVKQDRLLFETASNVKIQIQKQVEKGVEVIVGVKRDPNFGPVLMFGAGGTLAELIADRNLHLLPISEAQVKSLIEKSKIHKVLSGYRGNQPYAIDKLCDLIIRLSSLAELFPAIAEIEINPVIVTHAQAWAVDGKVILNG